MRSSLTLFELSSVTSSWSESSLKCSTAFKASFQKKSRGKRALASQLAAVPQESHACSQHRIPNNLSQRPSSSLVCCARAACLLQIKNNLQSALPVEKCTFSKFCAAGYCREPRTCDCNDRHAEIRIESRTFWISFKRYSSWLSSLATECPEIEVLSSTIS